MPYGQGWLQIVELAVALMLSGLIGLEREARQKSAGLRTHALIGFGAALFMLVSKYGFFDVLGDKVVLDPSRVAAQIVSGIGFMGGGLIFVKRDLVRGLTTAAAVWLTTAVGIAAGAGLMVLAVVTTVGYFVVIYGFTPVSTYLRRKHPRCCIEVIYQDGRGLLREILNACTDRGWTITQLATRGVERSSEHHQADLNEASRRRGRDPDAVSVVIGMNGDGSCHNEILVATLSELTGVWAINSRDPDDETDPLVE
jgi:putative Mg2+ transporter-C (MgtC) family protein